MDEMNNTPIETAPAPENNGKGLGIASMVLGIVGVVFWFFGITSIISLILGIIGVVCAAKSKTAGYTGGMRVAGLVLSIIAIVGGAIAFACYACIGAAAGAAGLLA